MWVRTGYALALIAALSLVGQAASAESRRAPKATRPEVRQAPIKDCTRLNGRFGYYGNPWCTAQEQGRWDRWSARQGWVR